MARNVYVKALVRECVDDVLRSIFSRKGEKTNSVSGLNEASLTKTSPVQLFRENVLKRPAENDFLQGVEVCMCVLVTDIVILQIGNWSTRSYSDAGVISFLPCNTN